MEHADILHRPLRPPCRTNQIEFDLHLVNPDSCYVRVPLVLRTKSNFKAVILKWIFRIKTNRPPLSLCCLVNFMEGKVSVLPRAPSSLFAGVQEKQIAVIVRTVADDMMGLRGTMKVVVLRFTETVRARIVNADSECLTFDQLAHLHK
ncbi:LOW QUALITY PROTEIN: hypothetical protein U9M48_023402 [Paspalum notatum var. saurae]|uniref:Large ribosomal subunit protein uL15/eL18 domain-containing protein n=1 Tax=Paspalum notatum var. saurae TaxID=547442 RepID=A0AAQ3TKD9_PASNO